MNADPAEEAFGAVRTAVLTTGGESELATRAAAHAWALALAEDDSAPCPSGIPAELRPYLKKVALHAYRVTDRDVEELRGARWSDSALLEVTMAVAVGAGEGRMRNGLRAVGEDA